MAKSFSRADNSVLGRWWWTIDRWILLLVAVLLAIGILLTMAASPPVAERIGLDSFYFVKRHALYMIPFTGVMVGVSLMDRKSIQRFSLALYILCVVMLLLTPFIGTEIKGARRWINLIGFSIQPSEFLKPALVILTAWMLAEQKKNPEIPGQIFAFGFYGLGVFLLLLQPDMGMIILMTAILVFQLFLAGLPLVLIGVLGVGGLGSFYAAYCLFPHVHQRVDRFLFPAQADKYSDRYQITQSLDAFFNGGFWGMGPGEGVVKKHLPDAHADFIFSVAGEEFGFLLCFLIIILFAAFIVRSVLQILYENDLFTLLAVSGLVFELGLQAIINMSSTLDLIPTKGMTLPFISFGGSSILSVAIITGMILALTRRTSRRFVV